MEKKTCSCKPKVIMLFNDWIGNRKISLGKEDDLYRLHILNHDTCKELEVISTDFKDFMNAIKDCI